MIFFFTVVGHYTDIFESALYVNLYGYWLALLSAHCKMNMLCPTMCCLVETGAHSCTTVALCEHLWLWLSRCGRSSINQTVGGSIPLPAETCWYVTERQIIKHFL